MGMRLEVIALEADVGEESGGVDVEMQEGTRASVEGPRGALDEAADGPQVPQEGFDRYEVVGCRPCRIAESR